MPDLFGLLGTNMAASFVNFNEKTLPDKHIHLVELSS